MITLKKQTLSILLFVSISFLGIAQEVEITLKNNTEKEQEGKEQLQRILSEYDISEWLNTKKIIIDEHVHPPHSHPILSLNCDYLDNDLPQLSTLLHEQLHWYLNTKQDELANAISDFKKLFPKVPIGGLQGGKNEYSTYMHLVNCDLELQLLTNVVSEKKARKTIESWNHYQWVYDKVLNDERVRAINAKHGLLLIENEAKLDDLKRLIGLWKAPDSIVNKIPQLKGRAVFKFEFDKAKSHIIFYEDISVSDREDFTFKGMVIPNPLSKKLEFFGVNAKKSYLFKGYFSKISENGFTREYQVHYPKDEEIAKSFGQVISFREGFVFKNENEMSFGIKYFNSKNKKWENWSQQDFTVIKK